MNSAVHLTDDEIDHYLIGDPGKETAAHLATCEACRLRASAITNPIQGFNAVSLAWSERQSATLNVPLAKLDGRPARRRAAWAAAAAAALTVSVTVTLIRHETPAPTPANAVRHAPAPVQSFSAEREAQIQQDNQMLQEIHREIASSVPSPADTFGFETDASDQGRAQTSTVRD